MNTKKAKPEKLEINNDVQFLIKIQQPENKKLIVSANDFNNFENKTNINNSSLDNDNNLIDNKPKIIDFKVENAIKSEAKSYGDSPFNVISSKSGDSMSNRAKQSVVNKPPSVLVIQNLAGKKVTIIPKSRPVVLNSEPVVTKHKNLIKQIPNVPVMNISDLNKSQQYFKPKPNLKIKTTESLVKKPETVKQFTAPIQHRKKLQFVQHLEKIQNVDLIDKSQKSQKSMPDFSKLLQVLTQSETTASQVEKIPIYVDGQTQTDALKVKDQAIQTERPLVSPNPSESSEELPNVTNLLEYVFDKYSPGLDEVKKTDLIDMSKTIDMKGKISQQQPSSADQLKRQLFFDLKDCNTFDFLGYKPIHNAVLENNLPLLKRQIFALRLRKISLDIENNQGQTALQLAIIHNSDLDLIATLLMSGVCTSLQDNEGNTLLHLSIMNSSPAVLELLLKHISDLQKQINRKNDEGLTALMIAAIESKEEQVELLLRKGADPNIRDEKSGRTALFHAIERNCNFVINLLLKHRADPKVRNYFGLTAIDAAKDLDIADAKILEEDKNDQNPTTVIVNMVRGEKRGKEPKLGEVKRSKPNINSEPKDNLRPNNGYRRKKP